MIKDINDCVELNAVEFAAICFAAVQVSEHFKVGAVSVAIYVYLLMFITELIDLRGVVWNHKNN